MSPPVPSDFAVGVHCQGKWIGLCGELGAKGSAPPLLVGLGNG
ncbi:hypothetical protein ACNKHQ_23290 [Shigella flexneri]